MSGEFEDFVNTELPKRLSSDVPTTHVTKGLVPVTTGLGLDVEFKSIAEIGLEGSKLLGYVTPEQFGCDTQLPDNRDFYQAALNYASSNRMELINKGDFNILSPLYLPERNLVWKGSGKIINRYDGDDGQRKLCFYPGTYNPVYFNMLSYDNCLETSYGQASIKLTLIEGINKYAVNDLVFIRSSQHYNGADGEMPLFGCTNKIIKIDAEGGVLYLEYPLMDKIVSPRIAKTQDSGIMDILGEREIYCLYNATVEGISFESLNGHITERGGMLGCTFDIPSIKGLSGIYTNTVNFSQWNVKNIDCDRRAIEVGGCSLGSTLNAETVVYRKTERSSRIPLISFNENMNLCQVNVKHFSASEFDFPSVPLIHILSAKDNTLVIDKLLSVGNQGSLVTFENLTKNAPGETQPVTQGNKVLIKQAITGDQIERFCLLSNPGGENKKNSLDGNFFGSPKNTAITMTGEGHDIKGFYSNGKISINTAKDSSIKVQSVDGIDGYTREANNVVELNNSPYVVKPKINSVEITPILKLNAGGGSYDFIPTLAKGGAQSIPFISMTALNIKKPLSITPGDTIVWIFKNDNSTTAITPTFDADFLLGGEVIKPILPTKSSYFEFFVTIELKLILKLQRYDLSIPS